MHQNHGIPDQQRIFYRCILSLVLVPLLSGMLLSLGSPVAAAPSSADTTPLSFEWLQTYGQDGESAGYAIVATGDGGAVTAGMIGSPGESDRILVIRTDDSGNEVWNTTLKESTYEAPAIVATNDNGYVISAGSRNSGTSGTLLVKLDQSGNEVWTRIFKYGELCKSTTVGITADGGFIIGGSVYRNNFPAPSLWNGFILKTNADGIEQWSRAFKGNHDDYTAFVRQGADDGYILTGTTGSYGINGVNVYLLKLNEFGEEEWFVPYGIGPENSASSVIQTPDGGYMISGTTRSGNITLFKEDLFLVKTDSDGSEQWRKIIPGWGKTSSGTLLLAPDGTGIIAQSHDSLETAQNNEMTLIGIDVNGTEQENQTFRLGLPFEVHGGAVAPQQGYLFTGTVQDSENSGKKALAILKISHAHPDQNVPGTPPFDLTIKARNAKDGSALLGAHVYLDGQSVGTTSETDGVKVLRDVAEGMHSIRVAKTGFEEVTRNLMVNKTGQVIIQLRESKLIPLVVNGPAETKIDLVFVASNTTYDCNLKRKIPIDTYSGDRQRFINDINTKVIPLFSRLDSLTSAQEGLQADYPERFNFYYYWDPDNFADAFDSCAGKLPGQFRNNVPATDVAIILYPSYLGIYSGSPCEPIACANGLGPGSGSRLKAPSDSSIIFLHESGHAVFGLIDTYCGDTYYKQNSPSPNVWSSSDACISNALQENWNTSECRQITKPASSRTREPCIKNFWKWDPDPDIMGSGAYAGRFGNASTLHIRYMLDTINRWNL